MNGNGNGSASGSPVVGTLSPMSTSQPETTSCPDCGARITTDPRFSAWCEACDWNVDPLAKDEQLGRLARWRRARSNRLATEVHERVLREGATTSPRLVVLAMLSAVPVHLLTVALVAADVWLAVSSSVPGYLRIGAAVILTGVLAEITPRWTRVPRGDRVLTPERAPASFAVLATVAEAAGTRPPDLLTVESNANASLGIVGVRRRRVIVIGMLLWNALSPEQKVAVLAHEFGHDVNRDHRRRWLLFTAVEALLRWARLLRPDRIRTGRYRGIVPLAESLVDLFLAGVYTVVLAFGLGLQRLMQRIGQMAEYRADLVALRVAGREAAVGALTRTMLGDVGGRAVLLAINRREPDVWAFQREVLAALPEREVLRAERASRRALQRVDDSHPPTHYRLDFLRAQPAAGPELRLAPDAIAAMDAELLAAIGQPVRAAR